MLSLIQMQKKLKKVVIGQDEAIHDITSTVYKFILKLYARDHGVFFNNSTNILLLGDSGTGKTFLASQIASLLNMCFIEINGKSISQEGWHGKSFIEHLSDKISFHVDGAIIFIDEFDKICLPNMESRGSDVSNHIQAGLLKYIEGFNINYHERGMQKLSLDPKKCIFIFAGAFSGLEKDSSATTIGFCGDKKQQDYSLRKALINYGVLPELLGRIQTISQLNSLTIEMCRDILRNEESIYTQYKTILNKLEIDFTINEEEILKRALNNGLGVRGLIQEIEAEVTKLFQENLDKISVDKLSVISDKDMEDLVYVKKIK